MTELQENILFVFCLLGLVLAIFSIVGMSARED